MSGDPTDLTRPTAEELRDSAFVTEQVNTWVRKLFNVGFLEMRAQDEEAAHRLELAIERGGVEIEARISIVARRVSFHLWTDNGGHVGEIFACIPDPRPPQA